MTFKYHQQFYQGQRWLGFAVFVPRKRIDSSAKNFSGLPLIEIQFSSHLCDVIGIDIRRIDVSLKLTN